MGREEHCNGGQATKSNGAGPAALAGHNFVEHRTPAVSRSFSEVDSRCLVLHQEIGGKGDRGYQQVIPLPRDVR